MAINSKNYVDISTTFPKAGATNRAFGGLVFTTGTALMQEDDSDYSGTVADYNAGKDISLSLDDVKAVFGKTSKEYEFAAGYYSYTSPSGRFPCMLKFKALNTELTLLDNFIELDKSTNAFGSFTFLRSESGSDSTASEDSYLKELLQVAEYNDYLDTKYLFVVNQKAKGYAGDYKSAIDNCGANEETAKNFALYSGVCFVYGASDVSAYMPMAILASTDYTTGQVVNFMFKQFPKELPTVFDSKTYADLNQGLVNFYGRTQSNGQTLDFFQRGFNTDGTDTASYCNEMWFKAECETALMNLLIENERLPADQNGVASVKVAVADVCTIAGNNGTFMQKDAASEDRKTVREIVSLSGGDELDVDSIIVDVGTKGYSIYAYLAEKKDLEKLGKTSEKIIVYYVFYGTADSVRYIKGNDILLK
jgi:hypothetical protein